MALIVRILSFCSAQSDEGNKECKVFMNYCVDQQAEDNRFEPMNHKNLSSVAQFSAMLSDIQILEHLFHMCQTVNA